MMKKRDTIPNEQAVMATSSFARQELMVATLPTPTASNATLYKRSATVSFKKLKPIDGGHLREKILGDVLVAAGVTLGVAPFISVVDKAIVQSAAGTHSIVSSSLSSIATMARNPVSFAKSPMFLMMWSVYAATYATANSLKTIMEHQNYHTRLEQEKKTAITKQHNGPSRKFDKTGVFFGTTLVNSASSLIKDRAYARMFGTRVANSMPMITYGLWATRDCMVVGSSFILPDIMSKFLQDEQDMDHVDAQRISQIVCPIATQFVAGPVQLLGLDFYNRPLANKSILEAALDRSRFLARGFTSVVSARVARIAPAYAIGGVFNTHYRELWRQRLIKKEIAKMRKDKTNKATRLVGLVTSHGRS